MVRLISLEFKRLKNKGLLYFILEVIILTLILILLIHSTLDTTGLKKALLDERLTEQEKIIIRKDIEELETIYDGDKSIIFMFVSIPLLIYSVVNFSRFVVKDYETGWLKELFTYSISRKKLLITKILLSILINFLAALFTTIIVIIFLYFKNIITLDFSILANTILNSLLISLIGLLPMSIEIIRKSSTTTIITGIVLVLLLQSNTKISLHDFPIINYSIIIKGLLLSIWIINKSNEMDLIN